MYLNGHYENFKYKNDTHDKVVSVLIWFRSIVRSKVLQRGFIKDLVYCLQTMSTDLKDSTNK